MRTAAKEATINGSGTIQLKGKGHLLVIQGSEGVANRTLTLDGVTLAGVADNNEPLVDVRRGGDRDSGRTGHFIMKSGTITGNTNIRSDDNNNYAGASGVRVEGGGTFTMEGGVISGNTAKGSGGSGGGGVRVEEDGTFIMKGGTISGNTAESGNFSSGGGVGVWRGTFTMEGGVISGNTAKGSNGSNGGGVDIGENSTFTLKGGTISGNTAESGSRSNGGGVNVGRGTFTMEGGVISGNTAKGDRGNNGGGVDIGENSTFTLKGGTIYGDIYGLPAGADQSLANIARGGHAALHVSDNATAANWGTGGAYTKGGVSQTGGSKIVPFSNVEGDRYDAGTSDTLIAK
jgi:hypothetical protein